MCGICGIALGEGRNGRVDRDLLIEMRDAVRHRGPDDCGIYLTDGVGLGHRRLSIVDPAGGIQPMSAREDRLQLVYNGEVYNHRSLRSELESRGYRYRTRSDTETVLHLYDEMGGESVRRLRGMFAYAIWDEDERELFLARDRLGIKPLYYVHAPDGSLFFASEIKSLLAAEAVDPQLRLSALPGYLANHAPSGSETMFEGVQRLPPGHWLRWRDGEIELRQYWTPELRPRDATGIDDERLVREFRDRFTESVRMRLMADVPLGVFLSGGLDSASIAAVMSDLVSDPIKTFSVAFAEREANELRFAREVAEAFGTDHHEVMLTPSTFFSSLPQLIWHEDEPLAHPSSVPLYHVAALASQHVKVVLTGEGSDELLGGYGRYIRTLLNVRGARLYDRWTFPALRKAIRSVVERLPKRFRIRNRAKRSFLYREPQLDSLYLDSFAVFSRDRQHELLRPEVRRQVRERSPYAHHQQILDRWESHGLLNRLLMVDLQTYLHELLMKQDQMSMAASIESRVPFLDQELVDFALSLPEDLKLRGATTKWILREAMRDVLPGSILNRSKMGFPVPFGSWMREDYRHLLTDFVLSDRAMDRGLFQPATVRTLVDDHLAGREDHSERLWSLLNLEIWQRNVIDGDFSADSAGIQGADRIQKGEGLEVYG